MRTLAQLHQGECAVVEKLTANTSIRRRLQDIGFIPGTNVECINKSPLGDPAAYFIRGSVIALRMEDSTTIWIR